MHYCFSCNIQHHKKNWHVTYFNRMCVMWEDTSGNGCTYHACCGRAATTCLLKSYWLSRAPDSQPLCPRASPTSPNCRKLFCSFRALRRNLQHRMSSRVRHHWYSFLVKIFLQATDHASKAFLPLAYEVRWEFMFLQVSVYTGGYPPWFLVLRSLVLSIGSLVPHPFLERTPIRPLAGGYPWRGQRYLSPHVQDRGTVPSGQTAVHLLRSCRRTFFLFFIL